MRLPLTIASYSCNHWCSWLVRLFITLSSRVWWCFQHYRQRQFFWRKRRYCSYQMRNWTLDSFVVRGVAGSFLGSFLVSFASVVTDELFSSIGVSFGDDDLASLLQVSRSPHSSFVLKDLDYTFWSSVKEESLILFMSWSKRVSVVSCGGAVQLFTCIIAM